MSLVNLAFTASCTVYFAGLFCFNFLTDTGGDYAWFDALQILATAGSRLFLQILSGAVMTLGVVSVKLETVTSASLGGPIPRGVGSHAL